MISALSLIGRFGRQTLILGLIGGLALPDLAEALRPWVGGLIIVLLIVTSMRVGAAAAFGSLDRLGPALARIAGFQIALPLAVLAVFAASGVVGMAIPLALVLMLAAPSVTGAPNFAIMAGADPEPGLRFLVLGTAFFPLTALPVLLFLETSVQGPGSGFRQAAELALAILLSVGAGFALRRLFPLVARPSSRRALDGVAAILLAVVVVGLMSAVGPVVRTAPMTLAVWLLAAFSANFGLVLATFWLARRLGFSDPLATAIYAGNRNVALFLVVLPEAVSAPLMLFIGCYQVPMYLTPYLVSLLSRAGTIGINDPNT